MKIKFKQTLIICIFKKIEHNTKTINKIALKDGVMDIIRATSDSNSYIHIQLTHDSYFKIHKDYIEIY